MGLQSSTRSDKSRPKEWQTSYHTVSFAQCSEAKIGRGKEASVRLEDVSLSRWHSTIKFKDGQFTVEDHESKFGTLLAMQKPWAVGPGQTLSVKAGCSVFSFSFALAPETQCTPLEVPERAACSDQSAEAAAFQDEFSAADPEKEQQTAELENMAVREHCNESGGLPFRRGLLRMMPERVQSWFQ